MLLLPSAPVVFVIPQLLATVAATPRRGVLGHVTLEAAVGAEAVAADGAAEWSIFTGHGLPPLLPAHIAAPRRSGC